jgi:hypothetical protein
MVGKVSEVSDLGRWGDGEMGESGDRKRKGGRKFPGVRLVPARLRFHLLKAKIKIADILR